MPRSLPALAAGVLRSDRAWHVRSAARQLTEVPLVPAYHVDEVLSTQEQPARTAQVILELTQKLKRLEAAYGSWPVFDPGPYFDLYPEHLAALCWVEELAHTVRVRIYADLLVPAFRHAERHWVESFLPAYHVGQDAGQGSVFREHLHGEAIPGMAHLLSRAEMVIKSTLALLSEDLSVLSSLGALEERIQQRPPPGSSLAPGLPRELQRLPREMPTLTLDVLFPRPQEPWPGRETWLEVINNQTAQ